jgi:uncharacterized membrane protein (DUF373 family)
MAAERRTERREGTRSRTAGFFQVVEQSFYAAVAIALSAAGAVLFITGIYEFVTGVADKGLITLILDLLDTLLLVFIVAELIHTVRAVIDRNVLTTEPFLIVGIVAAIRRIILISAEAQNLVGSAQFGDLMLEMGILVGVVIALAFAIFLVRHTEHTEPVPAHEPDPSQGEP